MIRCPSSSRYRRTCSKQLGQPVPVDQRRLDRPTRTSRSPTRRRHLLLQPGHALLAEAAGAPQVLVPRSVIDLLADRLNRRTAGSAPPAMVGWVKRRCHAPASRARYPIIAICTTDITSPAPWQGTASNQGSGRSRGRRRPWRHQWFHAGGVGPPESSWRATSQPRRHALRRPALGQPDPAELRVDERGVGHPTGRWCCAGRRATHWPAGCSADRPRRRGWANSGRRCQSPIA